MFRLGKYLIPFLLLSVPAFAQGPSMAERNLAALMQQIQPAVMMFAEDQQKQLAALKTQLDEAKARAAELEKQCGDACKK